MTSVKEAVVARFNELLNERGIRPNELANRSGVTPSSVYSMLDPRRKEVQLIWSRNSVTVWKSLWANFSAPMFLMHWNRKYNKTAV